MLRFPRLYPPLLGPNVPLCELQPFEFYAAVRLMFGSDWPVAELAGGYQRVWAAISSVLGQLPPADRVTVFGGTARFLPAR